MWTFGETQVSMMGTRPGSRLVRFGSKRARKSVPDFLRSLLTWLLWRLDDGRKCPLYADGTPRRGKLDSPEDRARLVTFDRAAAALPTVVGARGLGLALGPVPHTSIVIAGIDFDACYDGGVLVL
jgi:hypothetical protein